MEDNSKEPLLVHADDEDDAPEIMSSQKYSTQLLSNHSPFSSFVIGDDDIPPISGVGGFFSAFKEESIKLWYLAGPAILTTIFQYSLGAITQTFAGHVGTLDLAAFSVENSVIAGLCFGVMVSYYHSPRSHIDIKCAFCSYFKLFIQQIETRVNLLEQLSYFFQIH